MGTPDYDPVFYYYHSDHLGSSEVMIDRDGDPVQHYGYQPFGNERYKHNTQAFSVTNRYTGQQLDEDTGLYFYGSRYYDSALARFIQPDSVVPGSGSQALNRYSYCLNNPLIFTDPSGNEPITIAISIIVSASISAGVAAAQGGNVWKAALAGAIAGAFGGWAIHAGYDIAGVAACAAAGGALGALVTGSDPGMAAATATIASAISFSLFSEGSVFHSFEGSATTQYLKQLAASTGIGALAGGVSSVAFGGNFGEGAMWGAAGAAAGCTIEIMINDFMEPLANLSKKARISYKQKSNPNKKQYVIAKKVKDLLDIWRKAQDTKDPIIWFEPTGHGLSSEKKVPEGLGIIIGKESFGIGESNPRLKHYGIEDYKELIRNAFSQDAVIEIEVCGSCYNINSIGPAFKNILPNATVMGYTGFASYWMPGVWETRRHTRDPFCKWVEAK